MRAGYPLGEYVEVAACVLCLTPYPGVPFGTSIDDVDPIELSIWRGLHDLVCAAQHQGCDHAHE